MHPAVVQEGGQLPQVRHGAGTPDGRGGRRGGESGTNGYEKTILDSRAAGDSRLHIGYGGNDSGKTFGTACFPSNLDLG
jgi:hypothetical protein